ncbi:hypothetical protein BJS_09035 [Bradyrhizobium japonicum SEMIA 5079]|nr:hypothetical protein BJS_09035 [Bradyrhizobium japonicum SEMIA 5079]
MAPDIRPREGRDHRGRHPEIEGTMATTREHDQIVETATEARQGEPGPSVAALLAISTGLAILILAVIWFVFFRT